MIGESIGNYRIVAKLGQGGMGTVYQAEDTQLGRKVAIKVLNPGLIEQGGRELERFRSEAKVQASLSNPNIVTLYDFVPYGDSFYMVMEFVDGKSLSDLVRSIGALPPHIVVSLSKQILEGLAAAHKLGVVHRDLKPSNILLTPDGLAKVMDFGIAKVQGAKGLTATGALVGTVYYMSPEQVRGENVDARSDLYSFGVILFELLTGRVPFKDDSDFKIMVHHVQTPPPVPTQLLPDIPSALEDIVLMCLNKNPEERFQSAEAILAAFEFFEEQERAGGRGQLFSRRTLAQWVASGGSGTGAAAAPPSAATAPQQIPATQVGAPAFTPPALVDLPSFSDTVPPGTARPAATGSFGGRQPVPAPAATAAPAQSKKGLLVLAIVFVLLAAGGAGYYYFYFMKNQASPVSAQAGLDPDLAAPVPQQQATTPADMSATGTQAPASSASPGTVVPAGTQSTQAMPEAAAGRPSSQSAAPPASLKTASGGAQAVPAGKRNRSGSSSTPAEVSAAAAGGTRGLRGFAATSAPAGAPASEPAPAAAKQEAQVETPKLPRAFLIFIDLDQGSERLQLSAAQAQIADIVRQAGYQVMSTGVVAQGIRSALDGGDLASVRSRGIGYVVLGTAAGSLEQQQAYGSTYNVAKVNVGLELVQMSDGAVVARSSGDARSKGSANASSALSEALLNATSSAAREMMRQFHP